MQFKGYGSHVQTPAVNRDGNYFELTDLQAGAGNLHAGDHRDYPTIQISQTGEHGVARAQNNGRFWKTRELPVILYNFNQRAREDVISDQIDGSL